jgi:hypothetical protein
MSRLRPLIAVVAALALVLLIWGLWPDEIEEDVTNQISPDASDLDVTRVPERVEPVEGDGEAQE